MIILALHVLTKLIKFELSATMMQSQKTVVKLSEYKTLYFNFSWNLLVHKKKKRGGDSTPSSQNDGSQSAQRSDWDEQGQNESKKASRRLFKFQIKLRHRSNTMPKKEVEVMQKEWEKGHEGTHNTRTTTLIPNNFKTMQHRHNTDTNTSR